MTSEMISRRVPMCVKNMRLRKIEVNYFFIMMSNWKVAFPANFTLTVFVPRSAVVGLPQDAMVVISHNKTKVRPRAHAHAHTFMETSASIPAQKATPKVGIWEPEDFDSSYTPPHPHFTLSDFMPSMCTHHRSGPRISENYVNVETREALRQSRYEENKAPRIESGRIIFNVDTTLSCGHVKYWKCHSKLEYETLNYVAKTNFS